MNSENSRESMQAIKEELDQLNVEEVFTFLEENEQLSKGSNYIGSIFVLHRKIDKITGKYKASLYALGNQQQNSSFRDIKYRTVCSNSVKLLLALKTKPRAKAMVIDLKGAHHVQNHQKLIC
jgi:hypothetical protein